LLNPYISTVYTVNLSSSKRFAFFITCVHSLFYEVELPLSKKSLRFLHKFSFSFV